MTDPERENVLFELSNKNLLRLGVVAPDLRVLLPVVSFFILPFGFLPISNILVERGAIRIGPFGAVFAVVSWVGSGAVTAARYYDFRLTQVDDELHYERGLIGRYDGLIPIDKIQQLDVRENVLMRRVGYAGLAVRTAGYTPGEGPAGGSKAAVPLANRDRILSLARSIEGFDFDDPDFACPPRRTKRRYAVRYALAVVLATGVLVAANALVKVPFLRYWYAPLAAIVFAPVAAYYT